MWCRRSGRTREGFTRDLLLGVKERAEISLCGSSAWFCHHPCCHSYLVEGTLGCCSSILFLEFSLHRSVEVVFKMQPDHASVWTSVGSYHSEIKIQTPFHGMAPWNPILADFCFVSFYSGCLAVLTLSGLFPSLTLCSVCLLIHDLPMAPVLQVSAHPLQGSLPWPPI